MKKTLSTAYKLPALALVALLVPVAHAQIRKVVNAASFAQNTSLAPGSIVSVFGTGLTNATAYATDPNSLPKTLGGLTMTVAGVSSPLFYVSPTQVNAQIDPSVPVGKAVLTLSSPIGVFTANVEIDKAGGPGLFSFSQSGTRDGAVLNAITFDRGPFTVTTGGNATFLAIFGTGLDLSATPKVTIGGVQVPVTFAGAAPGWVGLQQINVQLPPSLAGAGRVPIAVTAGGKTSNLVEVVLLPNVGQGPFAPERENQQRNRELASIAYIPGTNKALLADENDDVIRVINVKDRRVERTIALPEGAEPAAIAVKPDSTLAVIAERDRGKIAVINLALGRVDWEAQVGGGPSSAAVVNNQAVVANYDSDTVSVVDLTTKVVRTVEVGRAPRSVWGDATSNRAYIANQGDGTVQVIELAPATISRTYNLGSDTRPAAFQITDWLKGQPLGVITDPSYQGDEGRVILLNLASGEIAATLPTNPDKSGGSSEIAIYGPTIYFANQTGASVTAARLAAGPPPRFDIVSVVRVDIGARALAIDNADKLLLVASQGTGNIVLVNLEKNEKFDLNEVVGRINGVRGENEPEGEKDDNRSDRERAPNMPVITGITPNTARAGATFTITIVGTNLTGATDVAFVDPATLPGRARGSGFSGNHGHGPFGARDNAFTTTRVQVNITGTTVTADIALDANAAKGERVVRVLTPNGESTFAASFANTFRVQ